MSYKFLVGVPQCDWLTLSIREEAIPAMYQYCKVRRSDALVTQRRHGHGVFTGFTGEGFFWGEREVEGKEWGLFICSGFVSSSHKREIQLLGLGDFIYCTRFDVQLTLAKPENYDPYVARQDLEKATGSEWGMIGVRSKGMTLTHGARSSDRYTRIYEKGDSVDDFPFLRWEVEFKGERSKAIWRGNNSDGGLLLGEIARSVKPGVSEIADMFAAYLDGHTPATVTIQKSKPAAIKWLEEQVSPCVRRLLLSHEQSEGVAVRSIIRAWLEDMDKADKSCNNW